jgi:hypothetical protein
MDHDQKYAMRKQAVISQVSFQPERRHEPDYLSGFPTIRASDLTLHAGDVLYMPARSFHYMEYEEPNVSVTVSFYLSEAEKWQGILGAESVAWQLLTNESWQLSKAAWIYYQIVLRIPACIACYPYLVAYPHLVSGALQVGMPRAAKAMETANAFCVQNILHPFNMLCLGLIGSGFDNSSAIQSRLRCRIAVLASFGLAAWLGVKRGGIHVSTSSLAKVVAAHHLTFFAILYGSSRWRSIGRIFFC